MKYKLVYTQRAVKDIQKLETEVKTAHRQDYLFLDAKKSNLIEKKYGSISPRTIS